MKNKLSYIKKKYFYKDIFGFHPMFTSDSPEWNELVKDIETLRQELIEDVISYIEEEIGYNNSLFSHMAHVVKEIINKRFGVE